MKLDELTLAATQHLNRKDHENQQLVRPIQSLSVFRQNAPSSFEAAIYEPIMILILQGRKEMVMGGVTYPMRVGECLLVSHDLPVEARVTKAPYLALLFDLDLGTLRDLHEAMADMPARVAEPRSLTVSACDPKVLDAVSRYLALAGDGGDARVLGPLVAREIHYRLATTRMGAMLRDLVRPDSHASSITRATAQLRKDFRLPVEIAKLARGVGMSTSAFHKHFKAITASSPLQYRKGLQLLEAQRLLRRGSHSVTQAAFDVGYESAAQFSRDYARKFGASPKHDLPQPREPSRA